MATLVLFWHKSPLYDWHWIFFGYQVLKIRQKKKQKKPHYAKQEKM
jgi:hypothetical protein